MPSKRFSGPADFRTPPAGGTHTLTATFTPTDTTDYAGGKQVTVTLTVNAAP